MRDGRGWDRRLDRISSGIYEHAVRLQRREYRHLVRYRGTSSPGEAPQPEPGNQDSCSVSTSSLLAAGSCPHQAEDGWEATND